MVHSKDLLVLKTKDGKFVTVWRSEGKLELLAVDQQNEANMGQPTTTISLFYRKTPRTKEMALRFTYEGNYYVPKVDGNSLLLEETNNSDVPGNDSHWFTKENLGGGNHYGLRSVVNPRKYLAIEKMFRKYVFILGDKSVLFRDEKASSSAT